MRDGGEGDGIQTIPICRSWLTDWDWSCSKKRLMGLSGGDGFYRGRPMDGSHAFTSKQGQAFLTPGRSRWPMMQASG